MWKLGNEPYLKEYRDSKVTISSKTVKWLEYIIKVLDTRFIKEAIIAVGSTKKLN